MCVVALPRVQAPCLWLYYEDGCKHARQPNQSILVAYVHVCVTWCYKVQHADGTADMTAMRHDLISKCKKKLSRLCNSATMQIGHWITAVGNMIIIFFPGLLHKTKTKALKNPFSYHAKWQKCESTEHATTSQLILRNSSARSLKAMISVGHTNVLRRMGKQRNTFFLKKENRKKEKCT